MKIKKEKTYLLLKCARSYDAFNANKTHLVSSHFYSDLNPYADLKQINTTECGIKFVLFVSANFAKATNLKLENGLFFLGISPFYFFFPEKDNNPERHKKSTSDLISLIFEGLISENKTTNVVNEILFIFEDLDFFSVQTFFKKYNIAISGGGRNALLTTTQYSLSIILKELKYPLTEIYKSISFYKYLKKK